MMKMYFYVDFYFILNFVMNLFLVLVTAMLRQKRCRLVRFLLLSGIHAAVSVGYTYFLWEKVIWQMAAALLQMGLLVFLAYEREGLRCYLGDSMVFFFLAFFTGGLTGAVQSFLMRVFQPERMNPLIWVLPAVILLFLLFFIFRLELIRQEHSRKSIRSARVFHGERKAAIQVLCDTGNQLISPYTGEAVAVISQKLAEELHLADGQNPVLIPYHSIGGSGLLQAYRMEYVRIEGGGSRKNMLAAISDNLHGEQKVQMILNITQS